jgi:hypothetical protein
MRRKVSSDWLPSFIKATRPVLEILNMAGYFPDRPRIIEMLASTVLCRVHVWLPLTGKCQQQQGRINVTSLRHLVCLQIRHVTLNIKYRMVYINTASGTTQQQYTVSYLVNPQSSKPKLNLPNFLT